jgi:hypothetical protein
MHGVKYGSGEQNTNKALRTQALIELNHSCRFMDVSTITKGHAMLPGRHDIVSAR